MSPLPQTELAWLLAADVGRRCRDRARAAELSHATLEEEVSVPGADLDWHVVASWRDEDDLVRLHGHAHVESPQMVVVLGGPERVVDPESEFDFVLPYGWLPGLSGLRGPTRPCETVPEGVTAAHGTGPCGLPFGHPGPHSWEARER